MKKLFIGIFISILVFTSCVSTSEIPMASLGLNPKYFSGKAIQVTAGGTWFTGSELVVLTFFVYIIS